MDIEYTAEIWQEADQYIAEAMPLAVLSSGATPELARAAVDEAVEVFLQTARDMGTLEEVLEECGYRKEADAWISPRWVATERHSTALPA